MPRGRKPTKNSEIIEETIEPIVNDIVEEKPIVTKPTTSKKEKIVDTKLAVVSSTSLKDRIKAITNQHKETILTKDFKGNSKSFGDVKIETGRETGYIEMLSTGMPAIDKLLGGGFQRGRVTSIVGKEGTGKSTFLIQVAANTIKNGEIVIWCDVENKWDSEYAESYGIDLDEIILLTSDKLEGWANKVIEVLNGGHPVGLIVVDSIAVTVSNRVKEQIQEDDVASTALRLSKFMNIVSPKIAKARSVLALVNQYRDDLSGNKFSTPRTPGGATIKYANNTMLSISRYSPSKIPSPCTFKNIKTKKLGVIDGDEVTIILTDHGFADNSWLEVLFWDGKDENTNKPINKLYTMVVGKKEVNIKLLADYSLSYGKKDDKIPAPFLASLGKEVIEEIVKEQEFSKIWDLYEEEKERMEKDE